MSQRCWQRGSALVSSCTGTGPDCGSCFREMGGRGPCWKGAEELQCGIQLSGTTCIQDELVLDVMDFVGLRTCVSDMEALCCTHLGSKEIDTISLDEPDGPFDELYFRKVVAWTYGLLFESGVFFRFSKNLVRSSNPNAYQILHNAIDIVRTARTVHGHNLRLDRPSDQDTLRKYRVWLVSVGGIPTDWEKCIFAFVRSIYDALTEVRTVWLEKCSESEGRKQIVDAYFEDKRDHWEAHEFDAFVKAAASSVGLSNFDCVRFRSSNGRLERWRRLVCCFDTRESAEEAVGRAILRELRNLFGSNSV